MTQGATEQTGQQGTGQAGAGGDAGQGQQQGGDQGAGQQTGQQQGAGQGNTAGQTGNGTGQQQGQAAVVQGQQGGQQQPDDGLTEAERNALSDPGKRALERVRGERESARTENETLRGQLQQALAQASKGTDEATAQQITTLTTERDTATQQVSQITAVMRAGLAVPRQGETGEQFATRMVQLAGMLQGADQAALDNSAAVLASLGTGQQQTGQQARTADQHAGGQGQGQAGAMSMDDLIRAQAGRPVNRG